MTALDLHTDADHIIEVIDAQRAANNPDTQLTVIQAQASAVTDPAAQLDLIRDALAFIEAQHRDADTLVPVLDDIWAAVSSLIDANNQLRQTTAAGAALAATFREQREAAIKSEQDLREAIENADWREPSIEMLMETIEEQQMEMLEYGGLDDMVQECIVAESPLTYAEAEVLYRTITGGTLIKEDDPIWESLKTWIIEAKEATERAFEAWRASRE